MELKKEDEELASPVKTPDKTTKIETAKKRDSFLAETINETIRLLLNQIYLRRSDLEFSEQEIRDTHFGANVSATLNHYFPDWSWDHPLWGLGASVMSLIILLNHKLPYDERKDLEAYRGSAGSSKTPEADAPSNPYLSIPKG